MSLMSKVLTGLLYPFVVLIQTVFTYSYNICGNYGIALILLSLFITAITAPLYYLAERWKNKEKVVQKKMHKDIKSINENYEGQKRFYLTKAARKIYDYKWWYTFRTSFGLIIQIPFFFAAYEVLSKYSGYNGVSFLFIKDLGLPDNLVSGVNVLPFVMTIINIAYSVYYTKSKSWNANKELYIMAGIFLVLLYNSPSALLLYWTMNNVFSFIKGIILRKAGLSEVPVIIEGGADKSLKEIIKENINIVYFFFFTLLCSLQVYWFMNWPVTVKYSVLLLTGISGVLSLFTLYIIRTKKLFLKLLLQWLVFLPFIYVFLFRRDMEFILSNQNLKLFISFFAVGLILYYIKTILRAKNKNYESTYRFFLPAIALIFWVCIYLPVFFYMQNPEIIDISFTKYMITLISTAAAVAIIYTLLYYFLSKNFRYTLELITVVLLLAAVIYSLFIKIEVGELDGYIFTNQNELKRISVIKYFFDAVLLSILVFAGKYIILKKRKQLNVFVVLCIIFLTVNLFLKYSNTDFTKEPEIINTDMPETAYSNYKFSKKNINIVYFLADMFNGNYIKRIIDEYPEYKEKLYGFVWYPDSLSISTNTEKSLAGLLGGPNMTAYVEYKKGTEDDMKVANQKAGEFFFKNVLDAGYTLTMQDAAYFKLEASDKIHIDSSTNYKPYWKSKHNYPLTPKKENNGFLMIFLAMFQSVPHFCKPVIYDSGSWIFYYNKKFFIRFTEAAIRDLAGIEILHEVSQVDTETENKYFLYIHNNLAHSPYAVNKEGIIVKEGFPVPGIENAENSVAAMYSAKKTLDVLIDWFEWMKKEGVYDNTVIYVFSDHGNWFCDSDLPELSHINYDTLDDDISHANTLVLTKQLNAVGTLKTSPLYIHSSDLPAMLASDTGLPNIFGQDPRRNPENQDRVRFYFTSSYKKNKYNLYYIKGSIFDPNSWSMTPPQGENTR
ncbi:preprotein translocase YidC [Treponema denticola]|uniref:YidC/Oxa1 family membrane protein insertase n=1 Tax=Treponema denticola TaxID=158 RepID=UPI0020A570E8|nr:YidC/Oxa1 family membrane protein insertase [Treponema denticola]UTC97852.1 preprotein translocase YidC [Treponema denticola]